MEELIYHGHTNKIFRNNLNKIRWSNPHRQENSAAKTKSGVGG